MPPPLPRCCSLVCSLWTDDAPDNEIIETKRRLGQLTLFAVVHDSAQHLILAFGSAWGGVADRFGFFLAGTVGAAESRYSVCRKRCLMHACGRMDLGQFRSFDP